MQGKHNQIIFERVVNGNCKEVFKYFQTRMIWCWILVGISFLLLCGGAISAAVTQIWGLFSLSGVGLIIFFVNVLMGSYYLTRAMESKESVKLDSFLRSKDFHLVMDIADYLDMDQSATLYILRKLCKSEFYSNYKIYNDIIFATSKYEITDEKVKKQFGARKDVGRINYNNRLIICPHCSASFDFANDTCPYCHTKVEE